MSTPSLAQVVERVAADLAARASGNTASPSALPSHPSLTILEAAFGLTAFERSVLALALALTIVPAVVASARAAGGVSGRGVVDPVLALALWPDGTWGAFTADAPLLRHRLLVRNETQELVLAEALFAWFVGNPTLDDMLRCRVQPAHAHVDVADSQAEVVTELLSRWARGHVVLCGADAGTRRSVAAAAAAKAGARLYRMAASDLPSSAELRHEFVRVWQRDARLNGLALLVEWDGRGPGVAAPAVEEGPGFWFSTPDPLPGTPAVTVRPPSVPERRAAWASVAAPAVAPAALDALAEQFVIGLTDIFASAPASGASEETLWEAARGSCRGAMEDLAQRIDARAAWDDLVVPPASRETLQRLVEHVRHRHHVQDGWGFSGKGSRGLGITALFHGPSGTGKTMAAEVIASALRLDLYRIDLSAVVSKYIGETEKHLRRLFDAAESGSSVLLFDEADSLFGKRSEVRDSHDRYANIEVGYLLSRMESYRGLAILTTNMKDTLDPAFLRRLRFVVGFVPPDPAQRLRIWETVFPQAVPREPLDYGRLARLDLTGGNIRNVALHAAFLAASAGERVGMRHIAAAARDELVRSGRPTHELRSFV